MQLLVRGNLGSFVLGEAQSNALHMSSAAGTGNPKHPEELPGTQPGALSGAASKHRATHNVQVGQNVSLRVLFVVRVNIWPCHHHQLQMFDSCLSPLLQARRSLPCWTAQKGTGRFKSTTKGPTDPLSFPKGRNNTAASPLLQGLAQVPHFCRCLSAVSSFSNTPVLSK